MSMFTLPPPEDLGHLDLGHLPWFPLHHKRLKDSDWWARATDFARSRNVDLWCEAFTQVPAGSLPNSDSKLAGFAGFGRDINAFMERKSEIMDPWVLQRDGRWYHPTLVEVALECWAQTHKKEVEREADRLRKREQRAMTKSGGRPEDVRRTSGGGHADTEAAEAPRPSDKAGTSAGPSRLLHQTGDIYTPPTPPPGGPRTSGGQDPGEDDEAFARRAWEALPDLCRASSSPNEWAVAWAARRALGEAAADLCAAAHDFTAWVKKQPELRERRCPGAHAWLRRGRHKTFMPKPAPPRWRGPADLRARIVAHIGSGGEAWAQTYLDAYCGWQDLPEPAVICPTGFVQEKVHAACKPVLDGEGVGIIRGKVAA